MQARSTVATLCLVVLIFFSRAGIAQLPVPPTCDSSPEAIARDEASLRETIAEALTFLLERSPPGHRRHDFERMLSTIEIESVGPARLVPAPPDDRIGQAPRASEKRPPASITEWIGVNPATCNQFTLRVPVQTRRTIAALARGRNLGTTNLGPDFQVDNVLRAWDWPPPFADQYGPPQTGEFFSGCVDTRAHWGTAGGPHRTVTNFSPDGQSSSCTGTMVGPRHVLTAAHCIYQGNNIWHDFLVIPGRNGTDWPVGSTQMSDTQGLNMGFRWYWVPAALTSGTFPDFFSGLDIGIIIIPQPLGEGTGWMGVVARPDAALTAAWHRNLGYPAQPGQPIGIHPFQIEGGLYGDLNRCDVGDFTFPDAEGWTRVADHSCDLTSGHSGGPIFHWFFDQSINTLVPVVSLIISSFPAFAGDFDCPNDPRPYQATRITNEYLQWFMFFRSWKS